MAFVGFEQRMKQLTEGCEALIACKIEVDTEWDNGLYDSHATRLAL